MTYHQKKTLDKLINICAKNGITGIIVKEKDGKFTVTRNGETDKESLSYDQCYAYLAMQADNLNTVSGILKKAAGKEMSKKIKKKQG